ncbi:hypothetical protein P152DRAFT_508126 [Eremomyces bilateralis CBS 781.70]|uniref:PH domain-containing protein n=1 Tax=Eremomyces bilateralis CBS 781.70 TaxID=1392243 RepID=A0A6G1G0H0_9PEZI|nr:uncharacterized protein P152DRAFT_508126 [Eremomyces bilateralis CBS 781.70]KAF1811605.1 hypothetical protein P152DRAFT_508126 [Eremomyces bilateralis CBS 781.70]
MNPQPSHVDPTQPSAPKLDSKSYTAQRLQHATPNHLHITARRHFIGPIPEGWLKTHRRERYQHRLHINYSSRAVTFSANPETARQRRLLGLVGPSASASFAASFPQPGDLTEADSEDDDGDADATIAAPSASPAPGERSPDDDGAGSLERDVSGEQMEDIIEESRPLREAEMSSDAESIQSSQSSSRTRSAQEEVLMTDQPNGEPRTNAQSDNDPGPAGDEEQANSDATETRRVSSLLGVPGSDTGPLEPTSSNVSLLRHGLDGAYTRDQDPTNGPGLHLVHGDDEEARIEPDAEQVTGSKRSARRKSRGVVHFDIAEDSRRAHLLAKARAGQVSMQTRAGALFRRRRQEGQIVKMEKMLIRVDLSPDTKLPADYDENCSEKIITRTLEKWREYMVVCREGGEDGAGFVLQIYETRVIPEFELNLDLKRVRVNLFSSLDKTLVLWESFPRGTRIFLLRTRSGIAGVEWHTFLRNILGWRRAAELQVNVPDLNDLEESRDLLPAAEGDDTAITKTLEQEQAVASQIVSRCLILLKESSQFRDVMEVLAGEDRSFGLAWRRYDRLEWIHGANERKMYGTLAMIKSHDLELRQKRHYATTVRVNGGEFITEPLPVEGFLVRLTSQRGVHQRMGKLFHKRLYFSTHDEFLVFNRPAKVVPPPPPTLAESRSTEVPASEEIVEPPPLMYNIDPFPVKDDRIQWLGSRASETTASHHDRGAYAEMQRKVNILAECDGCINLCNVTKVRNVVRGDTVADDNVDEGPDADYDEEVPDTYREDGMSGNFDDDRTFELVLRNGLIIRLQAYDKVTKNEWKRCLRDLVRYWKARTKMDVTLLQLVRKQNLEQLRIDEAAEAIVGQYARKWEVTNSFASSDIYNMCGPSCCRAIHLSGSLFRKPRKHTNFIRVSVILTQGKLLIFSSSLRTQSGIQVPQIHHEKVQAIDLSECYIYSGPLTEPELLYQNRTFDSNRPGRTALPRLYREDGWTSQDDDLMTSFVIWHSKRKSFFRSQELEESKKTPADPQIDARRESAGSTGSGSRSGLETRMRSRLKRVSQLGVTGRNEVFRTRSRAERDRWVLAIGMEIERQQGVEDVRIAGQPG